MIVAAGIGGVALAVAILWTRALMLIGGDAVDPPDLGYMTDRFRREWKR